MSPDRDSGTCPPDCEGSKDCETCKAKIRQEIKSELESIILERRFYKRYQITFTQWQDFWKERGL